MAVDLLLDSVEQLDFVSRASRVRQHKLRPDCQDSLLTFEFVLYDEEFSAWFTGAFIAAKRFVLHERAVLVQLELVNWVELFFRLKANLDELVFRNDLFHAVDASLRQFQCFCEAHGDALDFALVNLARRFCRVTMALLQARHKNGEVGQVPDRVRRHTIHRSLSRVHQHDVIISQQRVLVSYVNSPFAQAQAAMGILALCHFLLENPRSFLGLLPLLEEIVDHGAEVDGNVDVERVLNVDRLRADLFLVLQAEQEAEAFDCRFPEALFRVEVVERALSCKLTAGLVALVCAALLFELDFLCLEEEERDEVAFVLIDDHDVDSLVHLEINEDLIRDAVSLFLNFLDLFFLSLRVLLSVVFPHLADLERLFRHFVQQLLDNVEVVHGDLGLQGRQAALYTRPSLQVLLQFLRSREP